MIEDSAESVPQGWSLVSIGELLSFKNGLNKGKEFFGYGTPIVNYMDVFNHAGLHQRDVKGLVDVTNAEKKAFSARKGDVLFTRTSETPDEVGVSAVLLDDISDAVFSGFVLRGRPISSRLQQNYTKYCFSSRFVRHQIVSSATYTTRALINGRILSKVLLPLPNDPKEQEAIAKALSDADALIGGLKRLIAKKWLIKQGAMQELLTANRRLPGFSADWVRFKAGDFLNFKNGLNKAKKFFGHGTPIVNYMDVFKGGRIDATSIAGLVEVTTTEQSAYSVKDGDILFTRTSETPEEIGLAAVADGLLDGTVFSGFVLRGRPQNEKLTRAYSKYCFRSDSVRRQIISRATYTTRALTNGRQLSRVEVLAPEEPDEQDAIAKVLQDMDAEIQALQTRLKKAWAVKEGMMQNLLTGRIRLV